MVSHVRSFLLMSVLANYGSECHSRPNSGFGVAENDAAGSSLFTTAGTRGRAKSANGGMEFQHFPDSVVQAGNGRQAVSHVAGRRRSVRWPMGGRTTERVASQRASSQPAATGSFPNWHRLTQKKTSDDKKVDGLAR